MSVTPVHSTRLRTTTAVAVAVTAFDQNAIITTNNASAVTVTLPLSGTAVGSVNFPIGTQIHVIQLGAGATTVVKTGADTIAGTVATVAVGDLLIVTKTSAAGWHSAFAT